MATHTFHPDTHENGLADGCPRCDELAAQPLNLDSENMLSAWSRMLEVEFRDEGGYRSVNEKALCSRLFEIALFLQRYTPIDPHEAVQSPAASIANIVPDYSG